MNTYPRLTWDLISISMYTAIKPEMKFITSNIRAKVLNVLIMKLVETKWRLMKVLLMRLYTLLSLWRRKKGEEIGIPLQKILREESRLRASSRVFHQIEQTESLKLLTLKITGIKIIAFEKVLFNTPIFIVRIAYYFLRRDH